MYLALPRQGGRPVVALDSGSVHYLPSYSLGLNPIEAHSLPKRSYSTLTALRGSCQTAWQTALFT